MTTDIAQAPMVPRLFRVAQSRTEFRGVRTLQVEAMDGAALDMAPGQFNMLYAFGVGEVPISMSGADHTRIAHTVRAVGAVTSALCRVKRNDVLGVRGPFGKGWPLDVARGRDVVLVAGGIGMAPLRPVLQRIAGDREAYGKVLLVYGARTPDKVLYLKELDRLAKRSNIDVRISVDRATPGWRGHVGAMTTLLPTADFDRDSAIAMTCGPEAMMRFAAAELEKQGLGPERLYVSLERNMQCGIGVCGHCQLGPAFVCREGPVFSYDRVAGLMAIREV